MTIERWRPVVGFPAYEVSSASRVRRVATGKILRPWLVRGIACVGLRKGNETHKKVIARLVAAAFGGLPKGFQIDHRRGVIASHADILRGGRGHEHSSVYKGVSRVTRRGVWYSCIRDNGRTRGLGFYLDEIEAAKAYDRAAFGAWGDAAYLNFPKAVLR